jgi:hypothetical protein
MGFIVILYANFERYGCIWMYIILCGIFERMFGMYSYFIC